jgi:hypothetical protein
MMSTSYDLRAAVPDTDVPGADGSPSFRRITERAQSTRYGLPQEDVYYGAAEQRRPAGPGAGLRRPAAGPRHHTHRRKR